MIESLTLEINSEDMFTLQRRKLRLRERKWLALVSELLKMVPDLECKYRYSYVPPLNPHGASPSTVASVYGVASAD